MDDLLQIGIIAAVAWAVLDAGCGASGAQAHMGRAAPPAAVAQVPHVQDPVLYAVWLGEADRC